MSAARLPRDLHPVAWWVWALGMATAASFTTNPLVLLTIVAVATLVVLARRSEQPWADAFRPLVTDVTVLPGLDGEQPNVRLTMTPEGDLRP